MRQWATVMSYFAVSSILFVFLLLSESTARCPAILSTSKPGYALRLYATAQILPVLQK